MNIKILHGCEHDPIYQRNKHQKSVKKIKGVFHVIEESEAHDFEEHFYEEEEREEVVKVMEDFVFFR